MWFVPGDLDLSDLEGDGKDEPWQIVHAVIGFQPARVEYEHLHEDGKQCSGEVIEGHPVVLMPCEREDVLGSGPARVWVGGEGSFFVSRKKALRYAEKLLGGLLAEKAEVDALERLVHGDPHE